MGYTALYRKFRPDSFTEVKGQDAIVQTLKNQIMADRIGHAYLFCGTRGTGKTSIAKILAKTVNCEHPVDGNPCNECATCKAIASGRSMNVIEIDAASNNGVDNIREIREETSYSPTEGKYKVYIIDEVHMLSIGAFNALLKTLEEPPAYVIFILATTEVHKIPITILSRCQRYDFKRISIRTIADRLMDLVNREGVEVEEKAIRYIAKKADGSMRDALSLLDQCIAFYLGRKLTYDNVLEVLGAVDNEVFSNMLRAVLNRDVRTLMNMMEELIMQGRELGQFVTDFTWYLRNLLLVKTSDDLEDVLDVSSDNLVLLKEEAKMVKETSLIRYIRIFSELSNQMKYESSKRVALEVALIKLCKPEMEKDTVSILERLRVLEAQVTEQAEMLKNGTFSMPTGGYIPAAMTKEKEEPFPVNAEKVPAAPEDLQKVKAAWLGIAGEIGGRHGPVLREAVPCFNPDGDQSVLYVVFPDFQGDAIVENDDLKDMITQVIRSRIGKNIEIRFQKKEKSADQGVRLTKISVDEAINQNINFEIEITDNSEENQ